MAKNNQLLWSLKLWNYNAKFHWIELDLMQLINPVNLFCRLWLDEVINADREQNFLEKNDINFNRVKLKSFKIIDTLSDEWRTWIWSVVKEVKWKGKRTWN